MTDFKLSFIPVIKKVAEDFTPSTFTPFARRFTDERARSLKELKTLYDDVRRMHYASRYAEELAISAICHPIFENLKHRIPEQLIDPFGLGLIHLTRLETTILEFPDIEWD